IKVGLNATLENSTDAIPRALWYKDKPVRCFDFGVNSNATATASLYQVIDDKNNTVYDLVSTLPGSKNYTAFWNIFSVRPPASALSNITSIDQIDQYNHTG